MLIDDFMPVYDVTERHQIEVRAPIEEVYSAVRSLDLRDSRLVRLLFRLREFPGLFASRHSARTLGLTLEGLLENGFILLGEQPPREILLGVIGRFWTASGCIRRLDADGFAAFDELGYAKAAWNFSLSQIDAGTTKLATDTRVLCKDESSRRRFRLYWFFIAPFSGLIRREALRAIRRSSESGLESKL